MFKYWGGEYTIWLNNIRWGFNICMGMETDVNVMIPNYGKLGFFFDMIPMGSIIAPWFSWEPKLRAWLTLDLSFRLVVWGLVLDLHRGKTWKQLLVLKKVCFVGLVTTVGVYIFSCNESIPLILVSLRCFAGAKGCRREA